MKSNLTIEMGKVTCWDDFISVLSKNNLTLSDLSNYGLMKKNQVQTLKKSFKGKGQDKNEWLQFKALGDYYYLAIVASPDVAYCNKFN